MTICLVLTTAAGVIERNELLGFKSCELHCDGGLCVVDDWTANRECSSVSVVQEHHQLSARK